MVGDVPDVGVYGRLDPTCGAWLKVASHELHDPPDRCAGFEGRPLVPVAVSGGVPVGRLTEQALQLFELGADIGSCENGVDLAASFHLGGPRVARTAERVKSSTGGVCHGFGRVATVTDTGRWIFSDC